MCSLVFLLAVETHKTISRRNRVRSACEAGKQQRIQHGNRVSRFYSQNIRIIDSGVLSGADIQKSSSSDIVMLAGKYGILDKKLAGN